MPSRRWPRPPRRCATSRSSSSTSATLALVPSLIAYWDTLGWVYYAEGNLDKAEKYVAAAWALGQHGEVGDHLGQIYEKRGEKEKAIHTYALALSGLRPIPETRGRLGHSARRRRQSRREWSRNISDELQRMRTTKFKDRPSDADRECRFLRPARRRQREARRSRA